MSIVYEVAFVIRTDNQGRPLTRENAVALMKSYNRRVLEQTIPTVSAAQMWEIVKEGREETSARVVLLLDKEKSDTFLAGGFTDAELKEYRQ